MEKNAGMDQKVDQEMDPWVSRLLSIFDINKTPPAEEKLIELQSQTTELLDNILYVRGERKTNMRSSVQFMLLITALWWVGWFVFLQDELVKVEWELPLHITSMVGYALLLAFPVWVWFRERNVLRFEDELVEKLTQLCYWMETESVAMREDEFVSPVAKSYYNDVRLSGRGFVRIEAQRLVKAAHIPYEQVPVQ